MGVFSKTTWLPSSELSLCLLSSVPGMRRWKMSTEARSDFPSKLGNFSRLTPAAFHSPVPHFSWNKHENHGGRLFQVAFSSLYTCSKNLTTKHVPKKALPTYTTSTIKFWSSTKYIEKTYYSAIHRSFGGISTPGPGALYNPGSPPPSSPTFHPDRIATGGLQRCYVWSVPLHPWYFLSRFRLVLVDNNQPFGLKREKLPLQVT